MSENFVGCIVQRHRTFTIDWNFEEFRHDAMEIFESMDESLGFTVHTLHQPIADLFGTATETWEHMSFDERAAEAHADGDIALFVEVDEIDDDSLSAEELLRRRCRSIRLHLQPEDCTSAVDGAIVVHRQAWMENFPDMPFTADVVREVLMGKLTEQIRNTLDRTWYRVVVVDYDNCCDAWYEGTEPDTVWAQARNDFPSINPKVLCSLTK